MSDWEALRKYTQARIGLKLAGSSVSTAASLQFQFDHARARDAVHWSWDIEKFKKRLKSSKIRSLTLKTQVKDRLQYLTRPDLGKVLGIGEAKKLKAKGKIDIAVVVSNGLSSSAIENHGFLFLKKLWRELEESDYRLAEVVLVENARVALSDSIGAGLKAQMVLMILGERPGLSSFDSLALYLTYAPKPGNTDANRNCISNIRPPEGLTYELAIKKALFLVNEAFRRKLSGVELKEEADLIGERP